MANQLYGYNTNSYGGGAGTGNLYSSRSVTDSFLSAGTALRASSTRYLNAGSLSSSSTAISSSMLYNPENYSIRIPSLSVTTPTRSYGPPGVDLGSTESSITSVYGDLKRTASESLYHPTVLSAHNTIGQSEAWYTSNPLAKRPRYEGSSQLPIYPQRPGEKDCAYYMQTRTCKFGEGCKFDHPIWVPEGGIPDWKEVPDVASDSLPEKLGEPDCPYFMKTLRCKFGINCKFNHPREKGTALSAPESRDVSVLPERPSEPTCTFYMKTGKCKFGTTCKFHHPKDVQMQSGGEENGLQLQIVDIKPVQPPITPAMLHNSKGLPVRPGEEDCPFYLKTGSCKYGATCRYSHPNRSVAAIAPTLLTSPSTHFNIGVAAPAASLLSTFDPRLTQTTFGSASNIFPQRPGQVECDYYMKTGICKFGNTCKFHHPIDRSAPTSSAKESQQQNVKLTLAGLPRREGAVQCPYYMKTGTCKYGATCKFDHPPPGEVMAMAAASQGPSVPCVDEEKNNGEDAC